MYRYIKLVATVEQRNKLASEPNYHTRKHFTENLLGIEMMKTKVAMNKLIYLGMTISDISKTLMYKSWYDYIKAKYGDRAKLMYKSWYGYIKAKYGDRAKLRYTDTDSFIIHIFTENLFEDTSGDVERWFDTSNYDENDKRPLPIGMNKKELDFFRDELGGKMMKEFRALRPKAYAHLMDDSSEKKKAKGANKCVIKQELK